MLLVTGLLGVALLTEHLWGRSEFRGHCQKYARVQALDLQQTYLDLRPVLFLHIDVENAIKPLWIDVVQYAKKGSDQFVRSERVLVQRDGWILRWLGLADSQRCEAMWMKKMTDQQRLDRTNLSFGNTDPGPIQQRLTSSPNGLPAMLKKLDVAGGVEEK